MNKRNSSSKSRNHSHITSYNKSDFNSSNVNSSDVNSDSNMTTSQKRPIGVAILDTGIYRHIDFDNRIIAFVDFVNGQVMPYDDNGHGSHVRYRYTH